MLSLYKTPLSDKRPCRLDPPPPPHDRYDSLASLSPPMAL